LHADSSQILGNFSSSFLLEADLERPRTVLEHVQALTHELMRDLEHASISGVEVMEQYNKVGIAGFVNAPDCIRWRLTAPDCNI